MTHFPAVAPRVGAWIETKRRIRIFTILTIVAPRVGAWIETCNLCLLFIYQLVAPRVGAWIETNIDIWEKKKIEGRTPCGCVD